MSTIKSAKKVVLHLDNFSKENKAKLDKAQAEGLMDDWVYNVEVSILDENKKYTEEDMRKCFYAREVIITNLFNDTKKFTLLDTDTKAFEDYLKGINSLK